MALAVPAELAHPAASIATTPSSSAHRRNDDPITAGPRGGIASLVSKDRERVPVLEKHLLQLHPLTAG